MLDQYAEIKSLQNERIELEIITNYDVDTDYRLLSKL